MKVLALTLCLVALLLGSDIRNVHNRMVVAQSVESQSVESQSDDAAIDQIMDMLESQNVGLDELEANQK